MGDNVRFDGIIRRLAARDLRNITLGLLDLDLGTFALELYLRKIVLIHEINDFPDLFKVHFCALST